MPAPDQLVVPTLAERICPHCEAVTPVGGIVCLHCGVSLPIARPPAPLDRNSTPWFEQRLPVLAMLFFGFGPFTLPWLWRSSAFGRGAKAVLSVAVTMYFALLCLAAWWALRFAWDAFNQLEVGWR